MGRPCIFIRLQGCKLRCVWCDTPYALDHRVIEQEMSGGDILAAIEKYPSTRFVEFTGGEPLEQFGVLPLMKQLCDMGYDVAVETGGHVDTTLLDERVTRIIDVKCPDSKMSTLMFWPNLDGLRKHDEVKFVIASRDDYEWAKDIVEQYHLIDRTAAVLFSCAFGLVEYADAAKWILDDGLQVVFQPQVHKVIWDPSRRGV